MTVSSIQSDATTQFLATVNGGSTAAKASSTAEASDRFLKLLVTQLKNQDPMNPMDNAELTTQLAQMSTVEGVNKLNDSMDSLVTQFKSSQVMQGASMVGRQVLAEGSALTLSSAGAAGGFELASSADIVKVNVLNASGVAVQTLDLGAQKEGLVRFGWDGKNASGETAAEGAYTFKVNASAAGQDVTSTSYSLGNVASVALNSGAMEVEVAGLGTRGFNQIRQIF